VIVDHQVRLDRLVNVDLPVELVQLVMRVSRDSLVRLASLVLPAVPVCVE